MPPVRYPASHPASPVYQAAVLACTCWIVLGGYFGFDSVGALEFRIKVRKRTRKRSLNAAGTPKGCR